MSIRKAYLTEPLSWIEVVMLVLIVIILASFIWVNFIPKSERQIKQEKELVTQQEIERAKLISENKMTPDGRQLYTDPQTGCVYYNNYTYHGYRVLTIRNGSDGKQVGCGNVKE